MFVLIVGGGKVGLNVARSLTLLRHDFVVVEQRRSQVRHPAPELEDHLLFGDGTEMWVLEAAGIGEADLVVAVTGDDEDNVVIAQLAKHEYGVPKVVARVNDPRNQQTFDLLDVDATVCASSLVVSLIQHELPVHQFVPLLSLKQEDLEIAEIEVSEDSPAAYLPVAEIALPPGVLDRRHPARRGRRPRPTARRNCGPETSCSACCRGRTERSLLARCCPSAGRRTCNPRRTSTREPENVRDAVVNEERR